MNNSIILNDFFFLHDMKHNHKAMVNVYVNLPEGMLFTMDNNASRKARKNHRNDRYVPEEYLQISNNAIICVSCPVEEETTLKTDTTSDWEQRVEEAFENQN